MKLTGKTRYRILKQRFRNPVLVLQVEESGYEIFCTAGHIDGHDVTRWRDARVEDLSL